MFKSARRNKAEGLLDRIGGRVLEIVGRITGNKSHEMKGKAARGRGSARTATGRTKERAAR